MSGPKKAVILFLATMVASPLVASDPPTAAAFRAAFEAEFPKSEATAAALELERLAARLGLDLAPPDDKDRPHPSEEASQAYQAIGGALGQFLDRELKSSEERIGPPPPPFERYLVEHEGSVDSIESLLLQDGELRWELNVKEGLDTRFPNRLGAIVRVQRLLVARALIEARRGEMDDALNTLEASWRLNEALASRPELISQLIVVAVAKLEVGALRKVDSPGYGWADRLRSKNLFSGFLAAFQNGVWWSRDIEDLTGEAGSYGRVLRDVAQELQSRDPCSWTLQTLQDTWDRAARDESRESDSIASIGAPNRLDAFLRWRRFLIDAELTALVLDARAERAASRRRAWPAKLRNLGFGVCPNERWSYRFAGDGTATIAFEGKSVDSDSAPFRLPLAFTAGVPIVAPVRGRPTPKPGQARPKRSPTGPS